MAKKSKILPQKGEPYVGGVNLATYAHPATCVFIFLEFFDRINSYLTPLMFYWTDQDQIPTAEPGSHQDGLKPIRIYSGVTGEGWTQGTNQDSGCKRANVVFPARSSECSKD